MSGDKTWEDATIYPLVSGTKNDLFDLFIGADATLDHSFDLPSPELNISDSLIIQPCLGIDKDDPTCWDPTGLWDSTDPPEKASNNVMSPPRPNPLQGAHIEQSISMDQVNAGKGEFVPSSSRFVITKTDQELLQGFLDQDPYPDKGERESLTQRTSLSFAQVSTWFNNRRSRSLQKSKSGSYNGHQLLIL